MHVIDTLQKMKDDGYVLWASCAAGPGCSHFSDLDIDALIARFGPDFDPIERREQIVQSLVCAKCGRKGVELRLSPPYSSLSTGGTYR